MKKLIVLISITFFSTSQFCEAQWLLRLPELSKENRVAQTIGITEIEILYQAPVARGRKIMGKLVPYDKVWRSGAFESTLISFEHEVSIEGQHLPAGTYSFHTIPSENEWTVIFSTNTEQWGSFSYSESEDALRVKVRPQNVATYRNVMQFGFENFADYSTNIYLHWADTKVSFNVKVDHLKTSLAYIKDQMRTLPGYQWLGTMEAAKYLATYNYELDYALQLIDRSIRQEERFENLITKYEILRKLGKIEEAQKFLEKAKEKGDFRKFSRHAQGAFRYHANPEDAFHMFDLIMKIYPVTWRSYANYGDAFAFMEDKEKCQEWYQKAWRAAKNENDKERILSNAELYQITIKQ
ncbi:MAG: DUF2911 domain-containing protein [Flavobacteriaceae bacterium]|nr:DUF2911 domain-containing protein [Flavobacteriaceae bacterium]